MAWLMEFWFWQFFRWTSVAVFSHSAEHGICRCCRRSASTARASVFDDRAVTGVGLPAPLGAGFEPSNRLEISEMSFGEFMTDP
jgi:hypothetical protein